MQEPPIDPSSLTRWRQRLGEDGIEELLAGNHFGLASLGHVRKGSLKTVIVVPRLYLRQSHTHGFAVAGV